MSNDFKGPWGIASDYGWFHVYAFTMLLGMIVAILFCWYRFAKAKVPTDGLLWSIIFIIPASLFGGSFIGKDDPMRVIDFWQKFAFWKPGMSIHGGVLFGAIVGLLFFSVYKWKTKVSLWVYGDLIIPNILLGQVIGRWGNFFNHELLGEIVGYSTSLDASGIPALSFLPAFIRDNCFQLIDGSPEMALIGGQEMYVFRAPIFLYESIANFGFWVILTFLLPSACRWFSKKPWQIEQNKYQLLKFTAVQTKITPKTKKFNAFFIRIGDWFVWKSRNHKLKKQYWDQAFYCYQADGFAIKQTNQQYQEQKRKGKQTDIFSSGVTTINAYFIRSKKIYQLNNPKNYFVLRSGVQMSLYFFGWNLIRFCLELQREDGELFLKHRREWDYAILILIFAISFILAGLCQWVFARYFRNNGWTYEKEYKQ